MQSPVDLHGARQLALIDVAGDQYAEACPGSGKTWVIMGRYARRVREEPRKGIALVSFTNAAIREIGDRSRGEPDLVRSPNFVGTFDSFVHRFIVTPGYLTKHRLRPRYCESWSQLDVDRVRSGMNYLLLDELTFDRAGKASINWDRIDSRRRRSVELNERYFVEQAARRVNGLVRSGLLSSDIARHLATTYLRDEDLGPVLIRRIASRFAEIIVDEGQDCGEEEIEVLRALRPAGLSIFFVADPGQAIFEFRRSTPAMVAEFTRTLPQGDRLAGNRRSGPAICALAGSLRGLPDTDVSIGEHAMLSDPIVVIVANDPADIRRLFEEVLVGRGQAVADAVVLAHARKRAHEVAGQAVETSTSNSKLLRIANAVETLRSQPVPRMRKEAIDSLERAIVGAFDFNLGDRTVRSACEEGLIDSRWLRRSAYWLAQAVRLPSTVSANEFREDVAVAMARLECPAEVTLGRVRSLWPAPRVGVWLAVTSTDDLPGRTRLRAATIHSVKGLEFDSVLLAFEKRLVAAEGDLNVLAAWEQQVDQEAKRVLYVGATRAKRTLALAVTRAQASQVMRILSSHGVPVERVDS